MGMDERDIILIKELYAYTWLKISTEMGETVRIPTTRGSPQGDTLSPSIFVFFMNLCLRLLDDAGVGFQHTCGIRRSHAAFVDDQVL
eukprot:1355827-Rhodomonas_salina.1